MKCAIFPNCVSITSQNVTIPKFLDNLDGTTSPLQVLAINGQLESLNAFNINWSG